ncbi:hypothetical protein AHAS_Ahas17G0079000 [Arachis hypogaea]
MSFNINSYTQTLSSFSLPLIHWSLTRLWSPSHLPASRRLSRLVAGVSTSPDLSRDPRRQQQKQLVELKRSMALKYFTVAKMILQNSEAMVSIDMLVGPSEVLVIADKHAIPSHVAADLLSQVQ